MDDEQIVDLYWARSEHALSETLEKYGPYCRAIARNILHSPEDSEECVNDTCLQAWNAMPTQRPAKLAPFLGKITRNLALNRWSHNNTEKRGSGRLTLALEELRGCIPAADCVEQTVDMLLLAELLNRFLASLGKDARSFFMRRYWYFDTIKEISTAYAVSESKVKMSLLRSRKALKSILEKEGISV